MLHSTLNLIIIFSKTSFFSPFIFIFVANSFTWCWKAFKISLASSGELSLMFLLISLILFWTSTENSISFLRSFVVSFLVFSGTSSSSFLFFELSSLTNVSSSNLMYYVSCRIGPLSWRKVSDLNNILNYRFTIWSYSLQVYVRGHARLVQPPSRSSMWRLVQTLFPW